MHLKTKILDTKLYEVSEEQEQSFIKKLRRALFPHARHQKEWEIIAELFTWLPPGKFELPFQDVMLKTSQGKIDVKRLVHSFNGYPVHFQSDWQPSTVALRVEYRFLFDGTLKPFRLAHEYYEKTREMYAKDIKPNTSIPYKLNDLIQKLELRPEDDNEKIILMLCEVGVLSASNCQGNLKTGQIYVGLNAAEGFSDWYTRTISPFQQILDENRRRFWERMPIISWFMASRGGSNYLGAALGQDFFGTKPGLSRFSQLLIFTLFSALFGLSLYCGLEANWTPCSMFAGGAVALLIAMINKTL